MAKVKFTCARCGGDGFREAGDYNRKVRAGTPLFCSRDCFNQDMARRGLERRSQRARDCETCGVAFAPRQTQINEGHGRFCSQQCNTAGREALQRPESEAKKIEGIKRARREGRWTVLRGEENPRWRGGAEARKERLRRSGKQKEWTKRYRKNNPDKVREFALRRKSRKSAPLPYGTIPKIREMQKNRCAICRASLAKGDHLDHIMPLAKGGQHTPANLQLLCPPCNLAKSDRDPIVHMQSLGKLL